MKKKLFLCNYFFQRNNNYFLTVGECNHFNIMNYHLNFILTLQMIRMTMIVGSFVSRTILASTTSYIFGNKERILNYFFCGLIFLVCKKNIMQKQKCIMCSIGHACMFMPKLVLGMAVQVLHKEVNIKLFTLTYTSDRSLLTLT